MDDDIQNIYKLLNILLYIWCVVFRSTFSESSNSLLNFFFKKTDMLTADVIIEWKNAFKILSCLKQLFIYLLERNLCVA